MSYRGPVNLFLTAPALLVALFAHYVAIQLCVYVFFLKLLLIDFWHLNFL